MRFQRPLFYQGHADHPRHQRCSPPFGVSRRGMQLNHDSERFLPGHPSLNSVKPILKRPFQLKIFLKSGRGRKIPFAVRDVQTVNLALVPHRTKRTGCISDSVTLVAFAYFVKVIEERSGCVVFSLTCHQSTV